MIHTAPIRPRVVPFTATRSAVVMMATPAGKLKVVVSGAGGRTGSWVMRKLLAQEDDYETVGIVRSKKSAKQLKYYGAEDDQIVVGDILDEGGAELLAKALEGADRLVVCTSAVPKIRKRSLIPVIWARIFKKPGVRPTFTFKADQMPEQIDWIGQKMQFDAAKAAGVEKCVLVGSMGGTDPNNFLNTIGDGKILLWKRRAEAYLIASGMDYTIIHPGGLKDAPGGERELVLDIDDNLISSKSKYRSIPRTDVASLCIASLRLGERRAVDVVAKEVDEGVTTTDFAALFDGLKGDCSYEDMKDDEEVVAALAKK